MSEQFGRIALHTWTLETTPLEEAIEAAVAGGFDGLELRRKDFTACFDRGMSNDDVLELVQAFDLPVVCLGVEYGWLFADGNESERLFDVFRQSCRNARALGCELLMSAVGQNNGPLEQAVANAKMAGQIAGEEGVKCALEFNSQHSFLNNVTIMSELVYAVDMQEIGLLLDAYHLTRSGRPGRGFEEVPGELIYAFQYSDVPNLPVGDVKRPIDRLLPGEGIVDWVGMFGLLAEKNYTGHLSFEAPNPLQWDRVPQDVTRDASIMTRNLLAKK